MKLIVSYPLALLVDRIYRQRLLSAFPSVYRSERTAYPPRKVGLSWCGYIKELFPTRLDWKGDLVVDSSEVTRCHFASRRVRSVYRRRESGSPRSQPLLLRRHARHARWRRQRWCLILSHPQVRPLCWSGRSSRCEEGRSRLYGRGMSTRRGQGRRRRGISWTAGDACCQRVLPRYLCALSSGHRDSGSSVRKGNGQRGARIARSRHGERCRGCAGHVEGRVGDREASLRTLQTTC